MLFRNPDTGEEIELNYTPELIAMIENAKDIECPHSKTSVRSRIIQGGGIQIRHQCLECGQPIGSPLRKLDHPTALPFDENLLADRENATQRRMWDVAQKFILMRDGRLLEAQREYDEYISSPEWRKRRELVLARCKGLCEGCMENAAQDIHHLTYEHFKSEFLFELVALCRMCHDRIHSHTEPSEADTEMERPCHGCRFQGGGGECHIFQVPEKVALTNPKYCGPTLIGFEPLK